MHAPTSAPRRGVATPMIGDNKPYYHYNAIISIAYACITNILYQSICVL